MHRSNLVTSHSYFDFLMRARVESIAILRRLSRPAFKRNPGRDLSKHLAAATSFAKEDGDAGGKKHSRR